MDRELVSQSEASAPAGSDAIANLAYALWLSLGCPDGSPEEYLYEAERTLKCGAETIRNLARSRDLDRASIAETKDNGGWLIYRRIVESRFAKDGDRSEGR
jgi:hypothetical protein